MMIAAAYHGAAGAAIFDWNKLARHTADISVIIPTFNRGGMLREAVESVWRQTVDNCELIVVDDGSTDKSTHFLQNHPRARLISQNQRGVSAARNTGIAAAHGRYLAFLDSDDLWLPQKLAAQRQFFQRHPMARICQTDEIWIRDGRRVNPKNRHQKPSGMIFEPSLALCLVSPSAVMIARSLLDEVGLFNESLPACEDYDMWLRIAWREPIYLIPQPLIVKRGGHADQLSKLPQLDRHRIQALQHVIDRYPLSSGQRRAAVAMLSKKCRIYANGCRKRGRESEADAYQDIVRRYC